MNGPTNGPTDGPMSERPCGETAQDDAGVWRRGVPQPRGEGRRGKEGEDPQLSALTRLFHLSQPTDDRIHHVDTSRRALTRAEKHVS